MVLPLDSHYIIQTGWLMEKKGSGNKRGQEGSVEGEELKEGMEWVYIWSNL